MKEMDLKEITAVLCNCRDIFEYHGAFDVEERPILHFWANELGYAVKAIQNLKKMTRAKMEAKLSTIVRVLRGCSHAIARLGWLLSAEEATDAASLLEDFASKPVASRA